MKKQIQKLVGFLARRVVLKYKPKIIGITGSVGKTSSRNAIFLVVSNKYQARSSKKNFNAEFGLPFTILGVDSPGRNVFLWVQVIVKAICLLILPLKYPEVLVLEMGIDHPGDMEYLVGIVRPDVSVITAIAESHYANFENINGIEKEKGKLAEVLDGNGILVVNADNEVAFRQKNKTHAKVLSYGKSMAADLRICDTVFQYDEIKTRLKFSYKDKEFFVDLYAVGMPHVYAAAAAVAVGLALGLSTVEIAESLSNYSPAPGRLFAHRGINNSVLLDDSYNASPTSMRAALLVLGDLPGQRKIAVLGDMLELGSLTEKSHIDIAEEVMINKIDLLVTVGEKAKLIAEVLLKNDSYKDRVRVFRDVYSAVYFLQEFVLKGDVVLVKGSQGMRMEKISKELLADVDRDGVLLPRQYGKWLNS